MRDVLSSDAQENNGYPAEVAAMANVDIQNITCAAFAAMPETEQRAFVIGVANGRGMTSGLYRAYSGAAKNFAATPDEQNAIERSFATIDAMVLPLLEIDAMSLLNGIKAACKRPEFQNQLVINAIASLHVDAAKALRRHREETSG